MARRLRCRAPAPGLVSSAAGGAGAAGAPFCSKPVARTEGIPMFHVSRRDLVVGAAGAFAAFGLDKPLAFIGAAQAQTIPAGPSFKKYQVGDIEVISLYDGVWEKPHDENFIKGANVEQTKAELKAAGST